MAVASTSSTSSLDTHQSLNHLSEAYPRASRPIYSFHTLVRGALLSATRGSLTERQVIQVIEDKFPFFTLERANGCKEYISNTLTNTPCFLPTGTGPSQPTSSTEVYWTYDGTKDHHRIADAEGDLNEGKGDSHPSQLTDIPSSAGRSSPPAYTKERAPNGNAKPTKTAKDRSPQKRPTGPVAQQPRKGGSPERVPAGGAGNAGNVGNGARGPLPVPSAAASKPSKPAESAYGYGDAAEGATTPNIGVPTRGLPATSAPHGSRALPVPGPVPAPLPLPALPTPPATSGSANFPGTATTNASFVTASSNITAATPTPTQTVTPPSSGTTATPGFGSGEGTAATGAQAKQSPPSSFVNNTIGKANGKANKPLQPLRRNPFDREREDNLDIAWKAERNLTQTTLVAHSNSNGDPLNTDIAYRSVIHQSAWTPGGGGEEDGLPRPPTALGERPTTPMKSALSVFKPRKKRDDSTSHSHSQTANGPINLSPSSSSSTTKKASLDEQRLDETERRMNSGARTPDRFGSTGRYRGGLGKPALKPQPSKSSLFAVAGRGMGLKSSFVGNPTRADGGDEKGGEGGFGYQAHQRYEYGSGDEKEGGKGGGRGKRVWCC